MLNFGTKDCNTTHRTLLSYARGARRLSVAEQNFFIIAKSQNMPFAHLEENMNAFSLNRNARQCWPSVSCGQD